MKYPCAYAQLIRRLFSFILVLPSPAKTKKYAFRLFDEGNNMEYIKPSMLLAGGSFELMLLRAWCLIRSNHGLHMLLVNIIVVTITATITTSIMLSSPSCPRGKLSLSLSLSSSQPPSHPS